MFEVKSCYCCKFIHTKNNGEKLYCVKENCTECGDDLQLCQVGYYYHNRPTQMTDSIISVVSSMKLSPRETKQDNPRNEQLLLIRKEPNNYVILEVKNEHCGKVLESKKTGEKLYGVKQHCDQCDYDVVNTCELGYYFYERRPMHVTDPIISVLYSMMQSPRSVVTADNLKLCNRWSIVGKREDIPSQRTSSVMNASATLLPTKRGNIKQICKSESVIQKFIGLLNTNLKGCSLKAPTSVLNNDESLPVKITQDQPDCIDKIE